jgi:hypothetical protein
VRQLAGARNLDLLDSARFMALIAVAKSDAFVAGFDAKYHYDFRRPITAIRDGDLDDNAGTERDLVAARGHADASGISLRPLHPERLRRFCHQGGAGDRRHPRGREHQPDSAGRHASLER